MISIIVAIAEDYGIGNKNELLWHIPEDLKRFKKLTYGQSVIMGKKPGVLRVISFMAGRLQFTQYADLY